MLYAVSQIRAPSIVTANRLPPPSGLGGNTSSTPIIPLDRVTTAWSLAGIPGGIPDGSWPVCANVISYGADPMGVSDSQAAFQSAVSASYSSCPNGGVVYVPPGKYYLSSAVVMTGSNVVVRGAGMSETTIVGTSLMFAMGSGRYGQYTANWIGGLASGSDRAHAEQHL